MKNIKYFKLFFALNLLINLCFEKPAAAKQNQEIIFEELIITSGEDSGPTFVDGNCYGGGCDDSFLIDDGGNAIPNSAKSDSRAKEKGAKEGSRRSKTAGEVEREIYFENIKKIENSIISELNSSLDSQEKSLNEAHENLNSLKFSFTENTNFEFNILTQSILSQGEGAPHLTIQFDDELSALEKVKYRSDRAGELNRVREALLVSKLLAPQQAEAKKIGLISLLESDTSFLNLDISSGESYLEIAKAMSDIMTDLIPITSIPKDIYRIVTGKDLMTGENLENWELSFAVFGVISLGSSNLISRGYKSIFKVASKYLKNEKKIQNIFEALKPPGLLSKIRNKVNIRSADEVNRIIHSTKNPPYKPGSRVYEFVLEKESKGDFVRVFNDPRFMSSEWIVEKNAIEGMNPKQIKDFLSLPKEPLYIADVEIPTGVTLRKGKMNPIFESSGEKVGYQYEIAREKLIDYGYNLKDFIKNARGL